METHPAVRELPVVGGHLALDFANTVDDPEGPGRHDHAGSYPDLVSWAVRAELLTGAEAKRLLAAGEDEQAAVLDRAHELRRTLIATFTEIAADGAAAPRHWDRLRPFVTDAYRYAGLAGSGRSYRFDWHGSDRLDVMLWPVAQAAAELLTSPDLHRVKRCGGCPWLFVDRSRNGSRRWCAMEDCGTHAKIRRYVARRAARRTGSG